MEAMHELLSRAAVDTLEQLAFIFAMPVEEGQAPFGGYDAAACVGFAGPAAGTLTLKVSDDLLQVLTANMLGLEEDAAIADEHKHDALKELANVVCGNLLPEVSGAEAVFDIATPAVVAGAGGQKPPGGSDATSAAVELAADEGFVQLVLMLNASPEAGTP